MAKLNPTIIAGPPQTPPRMNAKAEIEAVSALANRLRRDGDVNAAAAAFGLLTELLPDEWLAHHNAGAVFLEAGRLDDAVRSFERAVTLHASAQGFVSHAHALALRGDVSGARTAFEAALRLTPHDFDANWGLFEVNQLLDDNTSALHHQRIALAERSLLSIPARKQPARTTILELCVAGTFQANIPLDFILDQDQTTVHKLFLGEHPIPDLPSFDVVFNTIADSPNAAQALVAADRFCRSQSQPFLNDPNLVGLTSRENVAKRFQTSANVSVARVKKTSAANAGEVRPPFPFLIRPIDSHAGNDLAKIDDVDSLSTYLAVTTNVDEFYLSEFLDYRNADGYYRKYRIVFVDGVPYPVHLAISPHWMIHYYNAPMADNAWMREEEHAFMRDMNAVFDGPRAAGLREIANSIPLEYFGIDCSIAADGRVLLFEASTAMIVHMRDPVELYPYKQTYVPRVIGALERLFDKRLQRPGR